MKNCLVFTLKGEFARFRKPYTTTSALTFITIHPLVIKGIIGAIMGIHKDDLYQELKDTKIGIQVNSDIKKDMGSFNLSSNKAQLFRFPSNVEFLRDVEYKIFVIDNEKRLNELEEHILSRYFVFTPYLGSSEHIAIIEYEGKYDLKKEPTMLVNTIVPQSIVDTNDLLNKKIYIDKIPIKNNEKREYTYYESVLIPIHSKLKTNTEHIYQVGEDYVYFF